MNVLDQLSSPTWLHCADSTDLSGMCIVNDKAFTKLHINCSARLMREGGLIRHSLIAFHMCCFVLTLKNVTL